MRLAASSMFSGNAAVTSSSALSLLSPRRAEEGRELPGSFQGILNLASATDRLLTCTGRQTHFFVWAFFSQVLHFLPVKQVL